MTRNNSSTENDTESTVEKRARFERFSMTVLEGAGAGRINVRNDSYGDEKGDHIYNVRVENGETVECSCPADTYQPDPCKHRLAVESRPIVLSSANATASKTLLADGGERK